jgi:hypothetical protein
MKENIMANETTMMTSHPDWGHSSTMTEKKYVYKEDNGKEYASKGVGGTALGLGIGALGLELLKNGNIGNILGNNNKTNEEIFSIYKGYRDADDAIIAKHNQDAFALYQNTVNVNQSLQKEIDDLKTKLAVAEAVRPYQDRMIYDAIALERERREANDCQIINYANCTYYPVNIADVTVGATSTQKMLYNPLSCVNGCGCNCR